MAQEIERGGGGRFQRTDGQPGRAAQKKAAAAAAAEKPSTLGSLIQRVKTAFGGGGTPERRPAQDVNLPDEQAGQIVGSDDTYDPPTGGPGGQRPFLKSSFPIRGGDARDPRWSEFNRRKTLQGEAERAAKGGR